MDCCEIPGDDPHECAIAAADERIEEVLETVELCDCQCHWPNVE